MLLLQRVLNIHNGEARQGTGTQWVRMRERYKSRVVTFSHLHGRLIRLKTLELTHEQQGCTHRDLGSIFISRSLPKFYSHSETCLGYIVQIFRGLMWSEDCITRPISQEIHLLRHVNACTNLNNIYVNPLLFLTPVLFIYLLFVLIQCLICIIYCWTELSSCFLSLSPSHRLPQQPQLIRTNSQKSQENPAAGPLDCAALLPLVHFKTHACYTCEVS